MNILPLFSYVVLERHKKEEIGGIIIPEEYQKRNLQSVGTVKACGRMCEKDVKALIGKEVLFKQHAGAWVSTPDGDEYFSLEETDIIGVVQ